MAEYTVISICLTSTGCSFVNTGMDAITSFRQMVDHGEVKGLNPGQHFEVWVDNADVAEAPNVRCVVIMARPKGASEWDAYYMIKADDEPWRLATLNNEGVRP